MIQKSLFLLFNLIAFETIAPSLLAQQVPTQIQKTYTEKVGFAAGGTIRVDDSYGDLMIEGWDRPEVEVTVIKSMPYDYKSQEATQHLDAISVTTKRVSENELTISTTLATRHSFFAPPWPRKTRADVIMEYQIHVPRDSKLAIHHGSGSVFVTEMTGDIEATGSRGDIMLMLPNQVSYSVDATTKLGTIVSDLPGDVRKHHVVGQSFVNGRESASRRMRVRMGYGGITIKTTSAWTSGNR